MPITTTRDAAVQWTRIDRAESLNALDTAHLTQLQAAFAAAADDAVRALVVTGAGRAFSVGADIKAMDSMSDDEFAQAAECYQALCRAARALDKPVIAAVNGYALGGGLEIALMADLRIAGASAQLGLPDAALGFSPTGGTTYLLNRIVGAGRALHLALTCEVLNAERALAWGLVTRVCDDDQLDDEALKWARQLAAHPPTGIKNIKRSFNAALESSLNATLQLEAEYDAACYRSPPTRRALKAFVARRRK